MHPSIETAKAILQTPTGEVLKTHFSTVGSKDKEAEPKKAGSSDKDSFRSHKTGPLNETNFDPKQASELLAETPEPVEFILSASLLFVSFSIDGGGE